MLYFDHEKFEFWKIYDSIRHYYPIGVERSDPRFFSSYEGQKDLEKLIVENLHNHQNYTSKWETFTNEVSIHLNKEIIGTTYGQAPSFSAFVLLDTIVVSNLVRSIELHFFVSLLGPYYTIIAQDKNVIQMDENNFLSTNYLTISPHGSSANEFQFLCDKIEDRFQGYRFVPFAICDQTIEGLWVRYSDDKPGAVLQALFNNHIELTTKNIVGDQWYKSADWIREGYIDTGDRWVAYPPG